MENKLLIAINSIIDNAKSNSLLGELDDIIAKNSLLNIFQIEGEYISFYEKMEDIRALEILYEYDDLNLPFDKFVSRIMGEVTPRNSEIIRKFKKIYIEKGSQDAIDWYYQFSQATKYIRMDQVIRDKKWNCPSPYGDIEISINLSKPEKDPRDIRKNSEKNIGDYPKCVLCKENIGYKGRPGYPERSNHRIIPIELKDEKWYLQFSPYVYYNQHLIVLSHDHLPMKIDGTTLDRLLDFIEQFPELFIGSNAGLPIVGGSILSHNHFQGGNYRFPIEKAKVFTAIDKNTYSIEILDWPVSTIKVMSKNRAKLKEVSLNLIKNWDYYENSELEIIPFTQNEKHNTTTLIARKEKENYILYISFRNNRTNEEYPHGIFHSHKENHHIKKENIGLIEVMGLAILPGRLDAELENIKIALLEDKYIDKESPHYTWFLNLREKYLGQVNKENVDNIIKKEVGIKFINVLENCGVFKKTNYSEFEKFINMSIE